MVGDSSAFRFCPVSASDSFFLALGVSGFALGFSADCSISAFLGSSRASAVGFSLSPSELFSVSALGSCLLSSGLSALSGLGCSLSASLDCFAWGSSADSATPFCFSCSSAFFSSMGFSNSAGFSSADGASSISKSFCSGPSCCCSSSISGALSPESPFACFPFVPLAFSSISTSCARFTTSFPGLSMCTAGSLGSAFFLMVLPLFDSMASSPCSLTSVTSPLGRDPDHCHETINNETLALEQY
ncbi:hypothetical protein CC78DRAFT_33318 [Lojkania enalia]|uniref:Uncharacterized protein n=1 Tax=Lojkania enalia TaxID=147567 RepID=A0A9P4KG15_9PLEO|nr:hypothetical protein CC78DRAFT_33318 [Didymosphaeria enalia]